MKTSAQKKRFYSFLIIAIFMSILSAMVFSIFFVQAYHENSIDKAIIKTPFGCIEVNRSVQDILILDKAFNITTELCDNVCKIVEVK